MQLVEDVFCYSWQGEGNNCNSYALRYQVDGKACYALIDPGHRVVPVPIVSGGRLAGIRQEPGVDSLLSRMKADGIDPKQIGLVINTHAHGDHCESSLWWKSEHDALVAVHESETTGYKNAVIRGAGTSRVDEDLLEPDLFLQEGELVLGLQEAADLQVIHTPGHSPGSVSIYWPARKVLIVGDLIFYRSVGRTDLGGGSMTQLRDSIDRLSRLDVEYLLTGHAYGHSGIISGKSNIIQNFRYILVSMLS